MNALDNWKQPYKYYADGTWEPYPIPELENIPDNTDWVGFLKSNGFDVALAIGEELSAVEFHLYSHKQHGYLVQVFADGLSYCNAICTDPPALICFMRDFSPMFNLTLSEAVIQLIRTTQETVFDTRDGIDAVRRVSSRQLQQMWKQPR
jgi:hypothetical protein